MIELRTGVPGSGKTLSMVQQLSKLFKRWETHPEEARPVFVSGIPDLVFPVAEMPLTSVQINKAGSPSLVPDWESMPSGSLVIIDECQGCFPPRSSATVTPAHVAWLNTHRHNAFDIWLTTQNPKLIDASVRSLVGKHQHYRRLFGGQRAAVYEWDACSDNLSGMKQAVISYWAYPKKVFSWYKSAESHTKQSFKLPRWLLIPVVGVVLGFFFIPRAFSVVANGVSGKGVSSKPEIAEVAPVVSAPALSASAVIPAATLAGGTPAEAAKVDLLKPFTSSEEKEPERTIQQLRLSAGVYGDDATQAPHYTEAELQIQARSVAVLAMNEDLKEYAASVRARELDQPTSITINKPEKSRPYTLVF